MYTYGGYKAYADLNSIKTAAGEIIGVAFEGNSLQDCVANAVLDLLLQGGETVEQPLFCADQQAKETIIADITRLYQLQVDEDHRANVFKRKSRKDD